MNGVDTMAKAAKDNKKQKKNSNESRTDLPDIKTNAQVANTGRSMKDKI